MNNAARLAVALWLLALLAGAVVVAGATYTADFSAFLPRAPSASERLLVQQLKNGAVSRLILVGIEGAPPRALAQLSRRLAHTLRSERAFVAVENGEQVGRERDFALLQRYRYLLSPAVTPQLFSVAGLHAAIAASIDDLAGSGGLAWKSLFATDPTGETLRLLDAMAAGRQPHTVDGVWFAADARRALLLVQTRASGADTDAQQAALAAIRAAFAKAQQGAEVKARLLLTGPGVFAVQARARIKHDALRLSLTGAGIVLVLLLLVYRSPRLLMLGALPIVSGVVAGIAAVALGFGSVHGVTLGFGTTLIGEAVDYGIYLFTQAGNDGMQQWRRRFWPTVRLGVATSVCGFAALLFSGFPGLSQLGLYSMAGLLAAALTTRFVLPALAGSALGRCDVAPLGQGIRAQLGWLRRLWPLPWLLGLAALALLALDPQPLWNRDLAALSPVSPAEQALDTALRRGLNAPDVRYLVAIPAAGREAALAGAERVAPVLQTLQHRGVIAGFDSPARYLPSRATQLRRRAALPDAGTLRQRLDSAVQGLPVQAATLAPFVAAVERARRQAPLTAAQLDHTTFATAVDALLLPGNGGWTALLPLRAGGAGIDVHAVRQALAAAAVPGALCLDLKALSDTLYAGYLQQAAWLALAGVAAIVLLIGFSLRSVAKLLRVLAPLACAVCVVAAGVVLGGQSLTLLHLVGLLLVVAIGSNYSLFFVTVPQPAGTGCDRDAAVLASLLIANCTTVAGFGVLALASVPVLQSLGVVVAPGAVLSLLFAALLSRPPAEPGA